MSAYGPGSTYFDAASPEEQQFLTDYDPKQFPVWLVTVDMVVLAVDPEDQTVEPQVLLIKRGNFPHKGEWALPGGFIDTTENPREAAIRELREEAGLDVTHAVQIGAFGAVGRDPRGPSISVAHFAPVNMIDGTPPKVYAGDDAVKAQWFSATKVKEMGEQVLAADHYRMIEAVLFA